MHRGFNAYMYKCAEVALPLLQAAAKLPAALPGSEDCCEAFGRDRPARIGLALIESMMETVDDLTSFSPTGKNAASSFSVELKSFNRALLYFVNEYKRNLTSMDELMPVTGSHNPNDRSHRW